METKDALSDLSSTTWEDGEAKKFRFSSENKIDQKTADVVAGRAERRSDAVAVALQKPAEKSFRIPAQAVFPTEHMRKIIAAAKAGKKVLDLIVYDGSETGEKLYNTLTVIGQPIPAGEKQPAETAAKSAELGKLRRWPVTVSYFDRKEFGPLGRADRGLYDQFRALRERRLARAAAQLSGFQHQRRPDRARDSESEALSLAT